MIEVKIPPEITQYDTKIIGPFSFRQAFCGAAALGSAYLIYHFFHEALIQEELVAAIMAVSIPFGLLGWIRPYGMRFETYFLEVLLQALLHPAKRYFRNVLPIHLEYPIPGKLTQLPSLATVNTPKKRKKRETDRLSATPKYLKQAQKKYRKQTYR